MDQLGRTRRATGLAGIAAAVLFVLGSALWAFDQPAAGASAYPVVIGPGFLVLAAIGVQLSRYTPARPKPGAA